MSKKSIAIMQPTFLPWVGYLALIDIVDEFIYLDHVQFDKRSWQQRNRIKTPNGPIWLTVPVETKGKADQAIKNTLINKTSKDFPDKTIKTIMHSYGKSPFYGQYSGELIEILSKKHDYLADLNIDIIAFFCRNMGLKAPNIRSSTMNVSGQKSALLVDICQKSEADIYLSPPGAQDYINASDDFEKAEIPVSYLHYHHPTWNQLYGDFIPYMSALDLLFNMGHKSIDVIRKGIENEPLMRYTRP